MKRLHVHLAVDDLDANIRFYSALFGIEPVIRKHDYAKWLVEDPRVNFAISSGGKKIGLDHVGIQAEDDSELTEIHQRFADTQSQVTAQSGAECCYARSDKYWTVDPQGTPWEAFHTLGDIRKFGRDRDRGKTEDATSCCTPSPDSTCCAN